MSSEQRQAELRKVAGALARSLRQQAEWGAAAPPPELAQRLTDALDRSRVETLDARRDSAPEAAPRAEVPRAEAPRAEAPRAEAPPAVATARPQVVTGKARPPWASRDREGRSLGVGSDALRAIRADLGDCERCGLCERRRNLVFGVGNPNARLMFVGEAPGADEDRKGEPFVGKAGHLLDRMIGAMKLQREEVYIANVVKCRPPGNRDPTPDEVGTCRPFLDRQIDAIEPECIVTLGRVAAQAMLGRGVSITRERGTWTEYRGVPMLLTLHPAYLLRQPAAKRDAWADLQSVMKRLGLV